MTSVQGMAGAELASMLKSSIRFKSSDGVKVPGLRLSDEEMQDWLDLKFGLFIHWGLYSIVGRGEWHMFNDKVPADQRGNFAPMMAQWRSSWKTAAATPGAPTRSSTTRRCLARTCASTSPRAR